MHASLSRPNTSCRRLLQVMLFWLQSLASAARTALLKAIRQLCLSQSIKLMDSFLSLGGLQVLVDLPARNVPEQEALLRLLILLTERSAEAAEQLRCCGGLPKLTTLLHSASEQICSLACNALHHMIAHKQSSAACKDCLEHHIPRRMTEMLQSGSPQLQLSAAHFLSLLAKTWRNSRRSLHSICGQSLKSLTLNADADAEVRSAASSTYDVIKPAISASLLKMPSFKLSRRTTHQSPDEQAEMAGRSAPLAVALPSQLSFDTLEHDQFSSPTSQAAQSAPVSPAVGPRTPQRRVQRSLSFQNRRSGSGTMPAILSSPDLVSGGQHATVPSLQQLGSQWTSYSGSATYPPRPMPSYASGNEDDAAPSAAARLYQRSADPVQGPSADQRPVGTSLVRLNAIGGIRPVRSLWALS